MSPWFFQSKVEVQNKTENHGKFSPLLIANQNWYLAKLKFGMILGKRKNFPPEKLVTYKTPDVLYTAFNIAGPSSAWFF